MRSLCMRSNLCAKMQCALHHNMSSLMIKKWPPHSAAHMLPCSLTALGHAAHRCDWNSLDFSVARTRCLTEACVLRQAGKDAQDQVQAAAARALQVRVGPCSAQFVSCIHTPRTSTLTPLH